MKNLLENYPKTASIVKAWLLERLLDSLNTDNVPDDFKEYARQTGIEDNHVAGILENSPSSLYELFDQHNILITIDALQMDLFNVKINGVNDGNKFSSRMDADRYATSEAFKLLNDK